MHNIRIPLEIDRSRYSNMLATLQNQNTTTDFYDIAEETTANGNGHADPNGLQGATARVI